MTREAMDLECAFWAKTKGKPHGYVLPNGVVVIYSDSPCQNNVATEQQAREMFPELTLMEWK